MSEFKVCASPNCTACAEVRRLRTQVDVLTSELATLHAAMLTQPLTNR